MCSFIGIVLVDVNIIAIYKLSKSSVFVYYQITQLSEQKYRQAIPFAEHNFGRFGRNFFVIVLFQSLSKTLLRVSFTSLYLQICSFIKVTHLYQATNVGWIFVVHSSRRWDYRFIDISVSITKMKIAQTIVYNTATITSKISTNYSNL